MNQHAWYNSISNIYDYYTVLPYQNIHLEAMSKLQIKEGDTVIDLGCKTGLSLDILSQSVGKDGTVIAVEPSKGMSHQAKKKAETFNLKNVTFIEQNIAAFIRSDDFSRCLTPHVKVMAVLVISVIPDWKKDLNDCIQAFSHGSQFLIMDLFSRKRSVFSFMIDQVAQANIHRQSWLVLEETLSNFMMSWYRIPFYFGIKAFITTEIKVRRQP